MASSGMDSLQEELHQLKQELQEKDDKLMMAAQFGKELLENNEEMTKQQDDMNKHYTEKLEALEQTKYSMQLKLDTKTQMEKTYVDEIESLKKSLKKTIQENKDTAEFQHAAQISQLKKQLVTLRADCDSLTLREKHLVEQKSQLEGLLEETKEQLEQRTNALNETCSEELAALHSEVSALQKEKLSLTTQLSEQQCSKEKIALQIQTLQTRVVAGEEELEEAKCQCTSYFNALEKSREEVQELRVELDLLRMESQDQKKKGNSLFSEVEDRRVEAERELISLKVQHSSLKKQYEVARQHVHKFKLQLGALLQMATTRTDVDHVERLESQLAQARSEIQELNRQLAQAQTQEKTQVVSVGPTLDQMSDKNFQQFVESLLKSKEDELSKLKEELATQRLLRHAGSDQVINLERKLYTSERQVDQLTGRSMKLQLQVEELQMKYEPDKFKGSKTKKGRVERIDLCKADSTTDKENKDKNKLVLRDAPRKNIKTKTTDSDPKKVTSTTTEKISVTTESESKPITDGKEMKNPVNDNEATKKPLHYKTANTRKVSYKDEPEIVEVSSTTYEDDSKLTDVDQKAEDEVPKCRPRGRERHNKVKHIPSAPKDSQCQQQ